MMLQSACFSHAQTYAGYTHEVHLTSLQDEYYKCVPPNIVL